MVLDGAATPSSPTEYHKRAAEARKDRNMNEDKLTGVEKSIHAAVETFQKNLCREMAKRLDEGRLIIDMETEVSFTTANVDEFIEEQIQELCGTLKPMEETLGADTAQETADEFADRMRRQLREDLIPNEKTLAALRKGVLEHGIPDGLMIDDGEKVRPCRCGGPMNSRGKIAERLMRDLEAAGAPVEVFNGKSGAEILDELVKILKMYNSSLKMAKEAQRLLHDLTRKDEKLS